MQVCRVSLLLLSLGAVGARRALTQGERNADLSVEGGGPTCRVEENDASLKFGIRGSYPVKSCLLNCKFHNFLTSVLSDKAIADPEDAEQNCKCFTSPFWEGKGNEKKFWFEHPKMGAACSRNQCKKVFFDWANMFNKFNKTKHDTLYPAGVSFIPISERVENQEGYTFTCSESPPEAEGLTLPSPVDKIHQLRVQIDQATDPAEKARLQQALAELLEDKQVVVEVFSFAPEWGPERDCVSADSECKFVQDIFAKDKCNSEGQVRSFRVKACKSPSGKTIEKLDEVFSEKGCGAPLLGDNLLPVMVDLSQKYDQKAELSKTSCK